MPGPAIWVGPSCSVRCWMSLGEKKGGSCYARWKSQSLVPPLLEREDEGERECRIGGTKRGQWRGRCSAGRRTQWGAVFWRCIWSMPTNDFPSEYSTARLPSNPSAIVFFISFCLLDWLNMLIVKGWEFILLSVFAGFDDVRLLPISAKIEHKFARPSCLKIVAHTDCLPN